MKEKLYKRLQQAMSIRGLRQVDLVEMTGLSKSKINMYVNGEHAPKHDAVYLLAQALGVQEAWLMGYDVPMEDVPSSLDDLSDSEAEHIQKYRAIDERGQETVDRILDFEYERCKGEGWKPEHGMQEYLYLGRIAAAGKWIYPGDIPFEYIKERRIKGADFIVGVSGNSMEPTFYDGDRVYIKKTTDIEFGEIGLFVVNGMYYIKEYAPDGLRSHNPKYALIPKDEEIIVVGKVLGKVEK